MLLFKIVIYKLYVDRRILLATAMQSLACLWENKTDQRKCEKAAEKDQTQSEQILEVWLLEYPREGFLGWTLPESGLVLQTKLIFALFGGKVLVHIFW